MIVAGLTWWQSWLCVWAGYFLASSFLCMTGRIGAVYHVGFPVISRSSFGIWGALWPVFNRAVMAAVWYGVQSWIGGECVFLMIRSIWESWNNVPNTMEGSGTTTNMWVSFFIFWLLSLPALWVSLPSFSSVRILTVGSSLFTRSAISLPSNPMSSQSLDSPSLDGPSRKLEVSAQL